MIPCIINTTCGSKKEAKKIAQVLIDERLAACIQMKKIESIYKWDGKTCVDKEWLLIIKTQKEQFANIERKIKENHSYDVPEILEIEVSNISLDYLKFIGESTI